MNEADRRILYADSADIKNSDIVFPVSGSDTYIQIFSSGKFVFEGKYSIVEYLNEKILVKSGKKQISIAGKRLRLKNVIASGFTVIGYISAVEFI